MRSRILQIVFFGVSITSLNCITEPTPQQFIVRVDSLTHSASVSVDDTIRLQLFGTIGPDGCHSFSHFETTTTSSELHLTVWGERSEAQICPTVMVSLDGREYSTQASSPGWYFINIHQPDGTVLRDSIQVN